MIDFQNKKIRKTKIDILPESKVKFQEWKFEIMRREGTRVTDYEILRRILNSEKVKLMAFLDADKRRKFKI